MGSLGQRLLADDALDLIGRPIALVIACSHFGIRLRKISAIPARRTEDFAYVHQSVSFNLLQLEHLLDCWIPVACFASQYLQVIQDLQLAATVCVAAED